MRSPPDGQRPVILVVESNAVIRMVATDALADAGYQVIAQATANDALVVLDVRADVQVIVTDVATVNASDGCALAGIAAARRPRLGIIMTSTSVRLRCHEVPKTTRFLAKPHSGSGLLEAVEATLTGEFIKVGHINVLPAGVQLVPASLKVSAPHTGIGLTGRPAQPGSEPEE